MSSPIEMELLKQACPQTMRPYCVGLNIGCGGRPIGGSIGLDFRDDAGAAVIVADARQLPIRTGSLDYIVSCHCLEHLRDGPLMVLREWVRCLKVGAPLAVCVPDGADDPEYALAYQLPPGKFRPGQHVSIFTVASLIAYLRRAGLDDVTARVHDREPYWKTRIIMGTGVKSAMYQEDPYRWRAWSWSKAVVHDIPILPRLKAEIRDRRLRRWAKKLFRGAVDVS